MAEVEKKDKPTAEVEKKPAAEVKPAAEAKSEPAKEAIEVGSNKVEVTLIQDHRCFIGGKWLSFKKDKKEVVTRNVFTVLKNTGLVKLTY